MTFLAETPEAEGARAPSAAPMRHERMIAAAETLARIDFARIGWALQAEGKRAGSRTGNRWQSTAIEDPALVGGLLGGSRNSLVIPKGRGLVIDLDDPAGFGELEAAGLPPTLTIDSPTPGHGHIYGWAPPDVDMATIPGTFARGEIRRHDPRTGTASMVLGPWSLRSDGTYTPRGDVRTIAELPRAVIDYLIASAGRQDAERKAARGPADPGWVIHHPGRHEELVDRARNLRGVGLTGDRLRDELLRFAAERCCPGGDGCEPKDYAAEIADVVGWTMANIADDPPAIQILPDRESVAAPTGIDAADLLALDLPPLAWTVPDILPEGTTIVASPPKIGKSCLVYQIAVEVALGGELLGRRVASGSALYLALEDGKRRGQERLRTALGLRTMARGRIEVRWGARRIGEGLEDDIAAWLDAHPDARLVAIDTLGRVRPRSTGKRPAYEVDVEDLGRLQNLFRDRPGVALLIVHHARKEAGDDFLAQVSGTYGITGSADTTIVLKRKRLEAFGTLFVTGRDVPDAEIAVRFDGLWHEAPASLPAASFERLEVYRTIEAEGPIFPKAIADRLDLERTSVQQMVGKLVSSGAVARTTGGYIVPRARVSLLPDISDNSGSEWSNRGIAREGGADPPALRRVPADPLGLAPEPDPNLIACADYDAHQALEAHRWQDGLGWVCHACEAVA
jgi:hypothetical protein